MPLPLPPRAALPAVPAPPPPRACATTAPPRRAFSAAASARRRAGTTAGTRGEDPGADAAETVAQARARGAAPSAGCTVPQAACILVCRVVVPRGAFSRARRRDAPCFNTLADLCQLGGLYLLTLRRTSSTMSTATMRLSAVAGPRARVSLGRVRRAAPAPARRGASLARRAGETSAEPAAGFASLADRAASYTADLKEMGMTMPIIRRNVAGPKNDLKALQVYQDALAGVVPEDEDEITRLEKVLDELNALRLDKAEEELFWAEREGQVVSAITDNASGLSESDKSEVANMVANITMYGVQGAVWNAMILLIVFVSIVNFLR